MLVQESLAKEVVHMTSDALSKPTNPEQIETIESRYGPVQVNLKQAMFFPKGLIGMPEMANFALANLPDKRMENFKLLQSLDDHRLSFVVLPLIPDGPLYDQKDIDECCQALEIKRENLVLMAIVTVQRTADKTRVTANIRAPLVVDSEEKVAIQYVFPNNKYQITHALT
ncbi:MAG: flagellar assembly protein FliW [Proteobacteria bacterium]|nr:flagellar assembly protein FliW [Pseudomonadota bacterium]